VVELEEKSAGHQMENLTSSVVAWRQDDRVVHTQRFVAQAGAQGQLKAGAGAGAFSICWSIHDTKGTRISAFVRIGARD
jgi:hypothetical protein